jgi:methylenetetrahydrofolate reductase (NADPH)
LRIRELYGQGRPLVSFEFFPPRTPEGDAALMRTVDALRPLGPAFVSITRTGAKPREAPVELAARIKALGVESAAHVTCIEASRDELARHFDAMAERGIENVVALRGDGHHGPPRGDFHHGSDLVRFIREGGWPFGIAGGGYPEGHPECRDLARGIEHLCIKVDAGCDVVITQLFFDNAVYFAFVARARQAGIRVPIVPGIMPITNVAQIRRIVELSGNAIPPALERALVEVQDDPPAALALGIEWATRQCMELLRCGAPGIHFYTLNQSPATRAIFENLRAEGLVGG